jgi:hypothetical protein
MVDLDLLLSESIFVSVFLDWIVFYGGCVFHVVFLVLLTVGCGSLGDYAVPLAAVCDYGGLFGDCGVCHGPKCLPGPGQRC